MREQCNVIDSIIGLVYGGVVFYVAQRLILNSFDCQTAVAALVESSVLTDENMQSIVLPPSCVPCLFPVTNCAGVGRYMVQQLFQSSAGGAMLISGAVDFAENLYRLLDCFYPAQTYSVEVRVRQLHRFVLRTVQRK